MNTQTEYRIARLLPLHETRESSKRDKSSQYT